MFDNVSKRLRQRPWQRAAKKVHSLPLKKLRPLVKDAKIMRSRLGNFISAGEQRLARPRINSNNFRHPPDADWQWRPSLWRFQVPDTWQNTAVDGARLSKDMSLFHDSDINEITIRQIRNTRDIDLAPFGVLIDVLEFSGQYLSYSINIPQSALDSLHKNHLICYSHMLVCEAPLDFYLRLNIEHGPNREELIQDFRSHKEELSVEFDLSETNVNPQFIKKAWLDVVFVGVRMNMIAIRDTTLSRCPGAQV